ncbi:MAG: hypothetical protein WCJ30_03040 [Deltaproteobacteria bacterium]
MRLRTTLAGLGIALLATAAESCSINGSRALGDDCVQSRECAQGLSCQPRADGRFTCQPVIDGAVYPTLDAGPADVPGEESTLDASAQDGAAD